MSSNLKDAITLVKERGGRQVVHGGEIDQLFPDPYAVVVQYDGGAKKSLVRKSADKLSPAPIEVQITEETDDSGTRPIVEKTFEPRTSSSSVQDELVADVRRWLETQSQNVQH